MALQICSIAPEQFKFKRTYTPGITIPACKKGQQYTSVVIEDHKDFEIHFMEYEWTKAKRIPVDVPAQIIINDFFGNEQLAEHGCFVKAVGETPTKEDLDQARGKRRSWLQTLVQAGDEEFLRSKRVDQIPTFCKRAVEELGVEREWAFQAPPAMFDCPVCAEKLKVGVALCRGCGAILDAEKAAKYGVGDEEKPRRGRAKQAEAVAVT